MPQQQLAGAQIARPPVDQRDLRPAQAIRSVTQRVEADQRDPLVNEPAVLARCQVLAKPTAAREQPVTCP